MFWRLDQLFCFFWWVGFYLVHVLLPNVMKKVACTSRKKKKIKVFVKKKKIKKKNIKLSGKSAKLFSFAIFVELKGSIKSHRGKFGGHHISLYVEKYPQYIQNDQLSKVQVFSTLSGDSISSYRPKNNIQFVF